MTARTTTALLLAALTLGACGGGGSGGSVSQPVGDTKPITDATGGTPTSLSSAQIQAIVEARLAAADSLLLTDFFAVGIGRFAASSCTGAVCTAGRANIDLSAVEEDDPISTYESILTKHGVNIFQAAGSEVVDGMQTESVGYGGWTDHGFFWLLATEAEPEAAVYFAGAAGDSTGTAPVSGSATWRGIMVGYESVRDEGHQGDATLTANFAASNIDVAFTNVRDIETGAVRSGFSFNDVPLSGAGFASRANGRIEGAFYGPGHAEVGGIFERGNTIGAFGAKRQ